MAWRHGGAILVALATILAGAGIQPVQAGLLFETASGASHSSVALLDDDTWLMHRFQVASPLELVTVGGTFWNFTGQNTTAFAAVVALSGPTDIPDSNDLTSADVLGTALVDIPLPVPAGFVDIEASGVIDVALAPGWYGLVFGTGAFGASSGPAIDLGMPALANDLAPGQAVTTLFQASNPLHPGGTTSQSTASRFFATAVPEASSARLGVVGFGVLAFIGLANGRDDIVA